MKVRIPRSANQDRRPGSLLPTALSLALGLLLTACAGGGGGDSGPGPNPTAPPASGVAPDVRAVVLPPAAAAALDLSTPERAATVLSGLFPANDMRLSDAVQTPPDPDEPAPTVDPPCADGGSLERNQSGSTVTVIYQECVDNRFRQDGRVQTSDISSGSPPTRSDLSQVFGSSGVSYLSELLDPPPARVRNLLLGDSQITTRVDAQTLAPASSDSSIALRGAVINLALSGSPRTDFRLGSDGTRFAVDVVFGEDDQTVAFSGPYQVSGACGTGSATVATPTPLTIDASNNAVAGQMTLSNGAGGIATYSFSAGGVRVDTAGGSQSFTLAQLRAFCLVN